jgi:hypothetical protein
LNNVSNAEIHPPVHPAEHAPDGREERLDGEGTVIGGVRTYRMECSGFRLLSNLQGEQELACDEGDSLAG